jgi:hypothetical protein
MSLRARLALLYTSIVGGILFLFGMAVYVSVSVTLTNQVDDTLAWAANQIVRSVRTGTLGVALPELDLFADIYIQVWGRNGQMESNSRADRTSGLSKQQESGRDTPSWHQPGYGRNHAASTLMGFIYWSFGLDARCWFRRMD